MRSAQFWSGCGYVASGNQEVRGGGVRSPQLHLCSQSTGGQHYPAAGEGSRRNLAYQPSRYRAALTQPGSYSAGLLLSRADALDVVDGLLADSSTTNLEVPPGKQCLQNEVYYNAHINSSSTDI